MSGNRRSPIALSGFLPGLRHMNVRQLGRSELGLLGVSAGAALGAMLAITFSWSFAWLGHVCGAGGELHRLARGRRRSSTRWRARATAGLSTNVLLLAGVTMNAFFSALILFVQYFADFSQTYRILRWLMGDLDVSSYAAAS